MTRNVGGGDGEVRHRPRWFHLPSFRRHFQAAGVDQGPLSVCETGLADRLPRVHNRPLVNQQQEGSCIQFALIVSGRVVVHPL